MATASRNASSSSASPRSARASRSTGHARHVAPSASSARATATSATSQDTRQGVVPATACDRLVSPTKEPGCARKTTRPSPLIASTPTGGRVSPDLSRTSTPVGAALDDEVEAAALAVLERRDGLARRDRHPGGPAAPQHARDLPRRDRVEAPLRERQGQELALAETHGRDVERELDALRRADAGLQRRPEEEDEHRRPLEQVEEVRRQRRGQANGLQPQRVREAVDEQRARLAHVAEQQVEDRR